MSFNQCHTRRCVINTKSFLGNCTCGSTEKWQKQKINKLQAENEKLRERLQKTTKYLRIRTKPQSKYSIPRLVDNIIKENEQALKG